MKKQIIFEGCATALITPFNEGKIDYLALEKIIEHQISSGISALVVGGTTGEVATLCDSERYTLFEFCRDRVRGRAKLIFGVGTNDTRTTLCHARVAERIGCDGLLAISPYYNKGTEDGLYLHFKALCEETGIPVLLYNVPSRTGSSLSLSLLSKLSEIPSIAGIKEAADSADRLAAIAAFGESLPLYAGADSQIYTTLSLGGHGVISVLSNAYPREASEICRLFSEGRLAEARERQFDALAMIRALFLETSPSPIKYLMMRLGFSREELRLPLATANNATRVALDREMQRFGKG